jgi:ABC-2 type transport system permease protein
MKPLPKPGFWLVARREWRWLLHDRVARLIFAAGSLSWKVRASDSRGLGVVSCEDRSEASRSS